MGGRGEEDRKPGGIDSLAFILIETRECRLEAEKRRMEDEENREEDEECKMEAEESRTDTKKTKNRGWREKREEASGIKTWRVHRKKRFASFPSPAGMSLPNSPWAGIMTS